MYICKVFEHLKQLWMGIWQHIHTVTTTEVSPDLGEFADILDDVSVEMISLQYGWGCRTFQTASQIYRCLNTLNSCGWGYGSTFIPLPPQRFPQIWESSLKSCDVNVEMIPLHYRWDCRTFLNCIPYLCHKYIRCLNTLHSCGWAYGNTLTPLPPQTYPLFWESLLKSYYVSVEMIPLHYHWGCRTFQTASHIHVIHILVVWTP